MYGFVNIEASFSGRMPHETSHGLRKGAILAKRAAPEKLSDK
jgi:hypothetical protein